MDALLMQQEGNSRKPLCFFCPRDLDFRSSGCSFLALNRRNKCCDVKLRYPCLYDDEPRISTVKQIRSKKKKRSKMKNAFRMEEVGNSKEGEVLW